MSIFLAQLLLVLSIVALQDASKLPLGKWNPRIVNGKPISIEEAPWQVALLDKNKHFCGGSIYSKDIIITAAHCVLGQYVKDISVRAGSTIKSSGGQVRKVASINIHEDYDENILRNDIAVLRLAQPLNLGRSIQPIPLAKEIPVHGTAAFVSGWGSFRFGAVTYPKYLYGVSLNVIDHKSCAKSELLFHSIEITDDMICAGGGTKDSCTGDSGGPLIANNQLVGVVSFGKDCGKPGSPGVYASVAYLHDWLLRAIKTLQEN